MGQEVQVRISDINTDNNTVNLSMVPAGAYDDRSGGGYGEKCLGGRGRFAALSSGYCYWRTCGDVRLSYSRFIQEFG